MEKTKVQKILVYTDFTEVGEKSIQWAVFFAKLFKRNLDIVHVINENSYNYFNKNTAKEDAKKALHDLSVKIKAEDGIDADFYVEEGCTCTIINSEAERQDAFFVLLGIHGKNDPQFLSGTSAIKIIRKARIPYFVIQKNTPSPDPKKNIVLPIAPSKETKQKTGWVTYFAKNVLTAIDIVYKQKEETDVKNNLLFVNRFFEKYKLLCKKNIVENKKDRIDKLALNFSVETNALMMVIITTKKENIFHKIFGLPETSIISNSKGIPILCINPKKDLYIPCV